MWRSAVLTEFPSARGDLLGLKAAAEQAYDLRLTLAQRRRALGPRGSLGSSRPSSCTGVDRRRPRRPSPSSRARDSPSRWFRRSAGGRRASRSFSCSRIFTSPTSQAWPCSGTRRREARRCTSSAGRYASPGARQQAPARARPLRRPCAHRLTGTRHSRLERCGRPQLLMEGSRSGRPATALRGLNPLSHPWESNTVGVSPQAAARVSQPRELRKQTTPASRPPALSLDVAATVRENTARGARSGRWRSRVKDRRLARPAIPDRRGAIEPVLIRGATLGR